MRTGTLGGRRSRSGPTNRKMFAVLEFTAAVSSTVDAVPGPLKSEQWKFAEAPAVTKRRRVGQ